VLLRDGVRILRAGWTLAAALLGAGALATLAYALGLLAVRPLIYGEAEVLFEASRMRDHLPLFVDPALGELDYGPVPTRCMVVYPPLWSWLLSHLPGTHAAEVARALGTVAWFGGLAAVAWLARPERRRAAWIAATAAAGVYVTALFATTGRPDAAAVALAGIALALAAREGDVGFATGALLALAAWVKPNVLGIAAGTFLFASLRRPRDVARAALGGLAVSLPVAAVLQIASHGAVWQHVTRSLGQPLALDVWWGHVWTRAMFLAPAAFTTWIGWHARKDPGGRLALFAWLGSLAWTLVSLGKIGSASNYWMEPAIAAVVVVGNAATPRLAGAHATMLGVAAVAASAWIATATAGSVAEAFEREPRRAALLARARADCGARPGEVVVADNPGGEMALDGRVIAPGLETLFLVREGHLPMSTWITDLSRPEVTCVLEEDGLFHAVPELRQLIASRFVEVKSVEDWRLYALRSR
jgi:hypothetical protein